jgi:hypothetical protein
MPSQIRSCRLLGGSLALGLLVCAAPAANAQWEIKPSDNSSIKFGFLVQGRADSVDVNDSLGNHDDTAQDLYFRRLRLLAGGKINDQWSFFFETDSPNLGKGSKGENDIYIQDFVVTYKPGSDAFNLDIGMLLDPVTYNSNQSAASLLTTDYGPYSFAWNGTLQTKVGRDYGLRARGYLFNDHLEYRASILQGNRGTNSTNNFRMFGRLMYNVFEAQKGLFYTGTTLGKKKLLSFGASYDAQEDYNTYGLDAFWDQPLGGGNGLTLQANYSNLEGDPTFSPSMADQENMLIEAGFYVASLKLLPFIQYAESDYDNSALADTDKFQVGLGYMFNGHNGNVKFSYANLGTDGADDKDEFWLQLQLFKF